MFINIIIVIAMIVAFYFITTTILRWLLPFILAYILAYATDPFVTFLERKARIPRKFASAIVIVLTLLIIVLILTLIVNRIIFEVKELVVQLPKLTESLSNDVNDVVDKGLNIYVNLPIQLSQFIDTAISGLASNLSTVLKPIAQGTTRLAVSLPSILVFIIVLFLSTYFMSSDKEKINWFIRKQMPGSWYGRMINIKDDLQFALLGYVKAQLILMSITFVEISIGLLIIGIEYAILLGLLISLIDALPILGTGTVLIPWALFSLVTGNYKLGLSLLMLYGVALLVRQLLEPRVLGGQIGLYPLITLMSMYVGLQVFGIIGMILGPILMLVIKNLHRAGLLRIWNE